MGKVKIGLERCLIKRKKPYEKTVKKNITEIGTIARGWLRKLCDEITGLRDTQVPLFYEGFLWGPI